MTRSSSSPEAADPHRRAFRTAHPGRLRSWRWLLLAALLVAIPLTATGVGAQSVDPVLVSNTGQAAGTSLTTSAELDSFAQSFTTGSHPDGYFLSSVDLGLSVPTGVEVEVSLWSGKLATNLRVYGGYDNVPRQQLLTLTGPSSIDGNTSTLERFSAHDVLLLPDTVYWIAVTRTAGDSGLSLATASSAGAVDGGGMAGFAIGDRVLADRSAGGLWTTDDDRKNSYRNNATDASMKIGLRGSEATRPPGPYETNRNLQPRADPVETGSSATRYAMSFRVRAADFLYSSGASSFELTSVLLSVAAESGVTPRVRVHADNNGSPAASALANGTLTAPADIARNLSAPGRAEFTASTAITLNLNTTYWVVLDIASGSGKLSVSTTASPRGDRAPWPFIGDGLSHQRNWLNNSRMLAYDGTRWTDHSGPRVFRMALNGTTDRFTPSTLEIGLAQVGLGVTARIADRGLRTRNESWQWQRGDTSEGPFVDIPAGPDGASGVYVPTEADLGKWLKAVLTYDNALGKSRTISSVTAQPVLSRSVMSNAGRRPGFEGFTLGSFESSNIAQAFTTGEDVGGYLLRGLRFGLDVVPSEATFSWAIHADDGGQPAAAPLFEPIAVAAGDLDADASTFEELAHPGFLLLPNTRYWAVLSGHPVQEGVQAHITVVAFSEWADYVRIDLPAELDQGSESGWAIDSPALASQIHASRQQWENLSVPLELESGYIVPRMSVLADPVVTASFAESAYTVAEGDDPGTTEIESNTTTVTVTLSKDPKRSVTIPITPTHRDGAAPSDYSGVPSSVTFVKGETEKTFQVTAVQDDLHEHDEDVALSFGTLPPGVNPGTTTTATLTITDDDGPPVTVSFEASSYTVMESDDPDTTNIEEHKATVQVTLSADPERTVTIPIRPTNRGGATDADYSGVPDELVFATGETDKTFTFMATHDTIDDDDESVELSFRTLPPGVSPGTNATATVSITDDDNPEVTVSFGASSYSVNESDDPVTPRTENEVIVTVTLSADPERTVTIPIRPAEQGGATPADYSGAPIDVTFHDGETSKTFTFTATHDTIDDDDESVELSFGTMPDPRVSPGTTATAIVSITDDDDPEVTVSFGASSYSVQESDDPDTTNIEEHKATVQVTLSADPERTVTIPIRPTGLGGATPADYSGAPVDVTFHRGETSRTFTFTATHDTIDDDDESVELSFGTMPDPRVNPGATATAIVSITDDDDPHVTVGFEASAYTVQESDDPDTTNIEEHKATVKVTLSANPERNLTIPITPTGRGGATPADYSGVPANVTFAEGETDKTFTFMATHDTTYERGESVELSFGDTPDDRVNRGTNPTATVWITDDDPRPVTVSFRDSAYDVAEDSSVVVAVQLNADPERKVTVDITVTEQGGVTSADYSGVPDEVVFNSGETIKFFTVTAIDDDETEEGEKIKLGFGPLQEAVTEGTPAAATISITDLDCSSILIWCGTVTLEYAPESGPDDRRRILTRTSSPLSERLHTDVFRRNGEEYLLLGPVRLEQGPNGSGAARPPYRVPERGSISFSLEYKGAEDDDTKEYWEMPNDDWEDWTLKISAVVAGETTEVELPFSEAQFCCSNYWVWFGRDLHDLATGWSDGQQYDVRIVSDPQPEEDDSPPGPPLYMRTSGVAASHAVVDWARPQLRDDSVPNGVTYKIQWKLETSSWHAPNAVSEHVLTPDEGDGWLQWTIRGLAPDTTYHVRAIATNEHGDSEPSNVWTFRTQRGPGQDSGQQQAANSPPTGEPSITGFGQVGETLTADTSRIEDEDGLTNPGYTYQWVRSELGADTGTDIHDATARTYIVTADDAGKAITVRVTFTDDAGQEHSLTSSVAVVVSPPPVIIPDEDEPETAEQTENTPASGEPYITGEPVIDVTLVAGTSGIADEDGLTNAVYSYQWLRHDLATETDTDIAGATGETYTVTADDEGRALRVKVSFTDDAGNAESRTSRPTDAVTAPPDTGPSLSDLDVGDDQEVLAAALISVGDRGRKNDDSQDRAWYATDTNAWHASGALEDGSLAWNEMTLTRVVYFADTGLFRFNEADPVNLGESFAEGGVNRELTIWVQAGSEVVSFKAKDHIVSSGSGYINFSVPDDARATLAAIAKDDLIIIAVSAPDTS